MGCVLCNLIQLAEKSEPFASESDREAFMNELANDIAQNHPELVQKIKVRLTGTKDGFYCADCGKEVAANEKGRPPSGWAVSVPEPGDEIKLRQWLCPNCLTERVAKSHPELKEGQIVTIFDDPISRLKSEGEATLVKFEGKDNDGIYNLEHWQVSFDDSNVTFSRKILPPRPYRPIEHLGLRKQGKQGVRTEKALLRQGVKTVEGLLQMPERDVAVLARIGPRSMALIKAALYTVGAELKP